MSTPSQNTVVKNKKAFRDYEISERYEAGIMLQGTEVKSLREGRISFKDSYARIVNDEIWVYNLHISPYHHGSNWNHDPTRPRKLLLHKYEIKRLRGKVEERGFTLIPLQMYFKNGKAKIEIGLARGKKLHDKRKDIAKKDAQRDAERELKNRYRINL
ncbi:SsrA-binding protein SmpB [candidate division KSB1 bacterium]|nr:SsrA-binding protein SmpB [candidate division KSB1 bacterium]